MSGAGRVDGTASRAQGDPEAGGDAAAGKVRPILLGVALLLLAGCASGHSPAPRRASDRATVHFLNVTPYTWQLEMSPAAAVAAAVPAQTWSMGAFERLTVTTPAGPVRCHFTVQAAGIAARRVDVDFAAGEAYEWVLATRGHGLP